MIYLTGKIAVGLLIMAFGLPIMAFLPLGSRTPHSQRVGVHLPKTALCAVIECKSPNSDFQEHLKTNEWTVVDFYADWCGPCKIAAKTFQNIAEEFPDKNVKFIKVDTEVFEDTVDDYGLKGLPVFGVFRNGELIQKHEGNMGKDNLLAFIQKGLDNQV